MNLLLDTHVLLRWLEDPVQLEASAREAIANPQNVVFVSAAVVWEIEIKRAAGKLQAPDDLEKTVAEDGMLPLPIRIHHARQAAHLPGIHTDPFDRMLVAQARSEGLVLATRDAVVQQYEVSYMTA